LLHFLKYGSIAAAKCLVGRQPPAASRQPPARRLLIMNSRMLRNLMKLNVGDKVRVIRGPFVDYTGLVSNIGSDGLVQVNLDLFEQGLIATFLSFELESSPKTANFRMFNRQTPL
jgi:hypothetical protein